MLELRDLRVFVAASHHESFTASAKSLGITQQSVSRTVSKLEDELGVVLMTRSTRSTRLTAAGALLAKRGEEMLRLSSLLVGEVRCAGTGDDGAIRIGVTSQIGDVDRCAAAAAVHAAMPDARVSLSERADEEETCRALQSGQVDLALVMDAPRGWPGVLAAPLRPTPMSVYVGEDHPLAHTTTADVGQFTTDALMLCAAPGDAFVDRQIAAFARDDAPQTVMARVSGSMSVALSGLRGLGAIGLFPSGARLPSGVREISVRGVRFPLHVAWSNAWPSPAVDAVRRHLAPPLVEDGAPGRPGRRATITAGSP